MNRLYAALAVALLAWGGTARAENLTIGTSADYPPWEAVDGSGHLIGFEIDLGNEICKRIKATCTWSNQAFDGLMPGLSIGKLDMVMASVNITPERLQKAAFSHPYARTTSRFVAAANGPLKGITDAAALKQALAGKTVGVQSGSSQLNVMRNHYQGVSVREYERADQMFEDLAAGRVDAIFLIESAADDTLATNLGKGDSFAGPSFSGADYPELGKGVAVALAQNKPELKAQLDTAVDAMLADGTVKSLSEKWFHKNIAF